MWPSPTFYKILLAAQILPCFFCKKKRAEVKEKETPPDPPGPLSSGRPNPAAHLPRSPPSSLFTRPSDRARWSPPNPVAVPVGEGIRATSPRPRGLPAPTHSPWTPPLPSLPLASPPSPDPPRPDALSPPRCCATASTGPSSPPRCVHEPRSRLLLRLHQQPQGGSHPSAGSVFLLDRRRRRFRLRPPPLRSCYSPGLRAPTR